MNPFIRLGAFLLLAASGTAQAATLYVSLDTSAWPGTAASLAFDLLDGDGSLGNNSVSISGFVSDATLGSTSVSGGASGSLPAVTLTDSSGFNEWLQFLTLGTTLDFVVNLSDNHDANGFFYDQFSLYLLDASASNYLITTSQPQPPGLNALFTYDMVWHIPGNLQVYTANGANSSPAWTVTAVVEPGTSVLFILGGSMFFFFSRHGSQLASIGKRD